ncbi:MAG: zinc metallopeptidase, partial [Clostridia bacterium]|nr:zinc metallopeptidase [Clostridia bacterium]
FTEQGVSTGLAVAYIIVSALIVVMAVVALVMWIMVAVKYSVTNKARLASGKTSFQVARETLDKAGLEDVQVKKASFIRAWFFGNSYSITKKTVFLRRNITDKSTVTAVGMALQKVGVAKMCNTDGKMAKTRNIMQIIGLFGPFMFIPVILIGFVIDVVVFNTIGTFSVVSIVIGLLILSAGFIVTLLNIPVEKKANDMALQMIDETGVMTAEERALIKKVFDAYIIAYIMDFIVTVLRIIQLILEILMRSQSSSKK